MIGNGPVWHVLPTNDAMEHREGMDCPCRPTMREAGTNSAIIVHNAFDGRVDDPGFVDNVEAEEAKWL